MRRHLGCRTKSGIMKISGMMFQRDNINCSPGLKLIWARFGKFRCLLLGLPTYNRRYIIFWYLNSTGPRALSSTSLPSSLLRQQSIITTYVETQCAFSSTLCLWLSCSICFLQSPCTSQRLHLRLKLVKKASLQCKFALAPQKTHCTAC